MNASAEPEKQTQYKANQTQFKPNSNPISERPKMKLNSYSTKDYEKTGLSDKGKTNPIQTQSNPTCSELTHRILKYESAVILRIWTRWLPPAILRSCRWTRGVINHWSIRRWMMILFCIVSGLILPMTAEKFIETIKEESDRGVTKAMRFFGRCANKSRAIFI